MIMQFVYCTNVWVWRRQQGLKSTPCSACRVSCALARPPRVNCPITSPPFPSVWVPHPEDYLYLPRRVCFSICTKSSPRNKKPSTFYYGLSSWTSTHQLYPMYFILKICLFQRECERACTHEQKGQREREVDSGLSAEPNIGLHLTHPEITAWAETKNERLNQLCHPRVPIQCILKMNIVAYSVFLVTRK